MPISYHVGQAQPRFDFGDSVGRSLGRAFEMIGERQRQQAEEEKKTAQAFKGLQEFADAAGIVSKQQSTPLSLPELAGRVDAWRERQRQDQAAAVAARADEGLNLQRLQLGLQLNRDQNAEARRQDQAARDADLMRRIATHRQAQATSPGVMQDLTPAVALDYEAAAGTLTPERLGTYLRTLQPEAPLQGAPIPGAEGFVSIGGKPYRLPTAAEAGWNLKPGQEVALPDDRKAVAITPNSLQVLTAPEQQQVAANYPWLLAEDDAAFNAGVRKVADPAERDRVLKVRTLFKSAQKTQDDLRAALARIIDPTGKSAGPGTPLKAPPGLGRDDFLNWRNSR